MASPVPGMDPYLEDPAFWPDSHTSFTYLRDALAGRLPPSYEARIRERVQLIQHLSERAKRIGPDGAVTWNEGPAPASP